MKKSRLDQILDDADVLKDVKDYDTGMMVYQSDKVLDYLILTYAGHCLVYLYDGDRDILVDAKAKSLEDAKELAVEKMEVKLNRNYHWHLIWGVFFNWLNIPSYRIM